MESVGGSYESKGEYKSSKVEEFQSGSADSSGPVERAGPWSDENHHNRIEFWMRRGAHSYSVHYREGVYGA